MPAEGLLTRHQEIHLQPQENGAGSKALEIVGADGSDYLLRVQALLRTGILLKARHSPEPDAEFTTCVNTRRTRAHALLDAPRAERAEAKVRLRLGKQRDHLFTLLEEPAVLRPTIWPSANRGRR